MQDRGEHKPQVQRVNPAPRTNSLTHLASGKMDTPLGSIVVNVNPRYRGIILLPANTECLVGLSIYLFMPVIIFFFGPQLLYLLYICNLYSLPFLICPEQDFLSVSLVILSL